MRAGIGLRFYHLPVEGTYEVSTYAGVTLGTVEKFSKGWTARYKDGRNVGWFAKRAEAGDALFRHKRRIAPDFPSARRSEEARTEGDSYQTVVNDLANRLTEAGERIAELENDLHIANEAFLEVLARCAELIRSIEDIDAHATPLGSDEDGFVSTGYLVSVGAIHRALGVARGTQLPSAPLPSRKDPPTA